MSVTTPGAAPVEPPRPAIRKRSGLSLVWIIPVLVAITGGWLIVKTLNEKGPVISISFKTAEGIEAGKTRLRYKNIEVGLVESIRFNDAASRVLVRAQMAHDAAPFLRRGTRFWVVRPQLSLRGVSGLSTLVSGAYIDIEPGSGAEQRHFEGLEMPPVVRSTDPGRRITLISERLGSVDTGSPISYRGIPAGEVLGHALATDQRSVLLYAFIKAPFDQLIRGNTRFWNVSGIDVTLDSKGLAVRTESMRSVLFGGIAFETPENAEPLNANLDEMVFTLYDSKENIIEKAFTKRIRFVMFFDGSVRGLNIGAPVEFKGIKVGNVVDIRLEFDRSNTSFRIPVVVEIEPERIIARGETQATNPLGILKTLVERGLRARLATGSLLTGQLFVELDMHPNTPVHLAKSSGPYPQLPTLPARLEEITASVKDVLQKVNQLNFKKINDELIGTLEGTNRLVNAPEFSAALGELESTLSRFRALVTKVAKRVDPLVDNVDRTVTTGRQALAQLQGTLKLVDGLLKSDAPLQAGYIKLADELGETARSIKSFVDLLSRNPEAFIFGRKPR